MKMPDGVPWVLDTLHSKLHELVTFANPQGGLPKSAAGVRRVKVRDRSIVDPMMRSVPEHYCRHAPLLCVELARIVP